MHRSSSWRGSPRPIRRRHSGYLDGLPPRPRVGLRVLVEVAYWLAIVILGGYAIFAPVLPEGGAL